MEESSDKKKKRKMGPISRVIVVLFALFFIVSLFLFAVLYVPALQNFTVDHIVDKLSDRINGRVEVGEIKVNVFRGVVMDDFSVINEKNGDTVLYAEQFTAGLKNNLWSLVSNELEVNRVELKGLSLRDVKGDESSYSKIAELFKKVDQDQVITEDTLIQKPKEKKEFLLDIDEVVLSEFSYVFIDSFRGEQRNLSVPKAIINVDSIALAGQDFFLSSVEAPKVDFKLTYFEKKDGLASESLILDGEVQSIPDTFDLYVDRILISDGTFNLTDQTKRPHPIANEFDPANFVANKVTLDISNFYTNSQVEIEAHINDGSLESADGQIEIESFQCGTFSLGARRMVFDDLEMRTAKSVLKDNLVFKFRDIKDFNDFNNKVIIDADVRNSTLNIRELVYFAPGMKKSSYFLENLDRKFDLDGKVLGRVNSLNSPSMNINLGEDILVKGRMNSRNLSDVDDALLNLKLDEFTVSVSTLSELIPGFVAPPNFFKLGKLKFDGRFDGYFQDFVAFGALSSDLGYADLDMRLDLKEGSENAQYSGSALLRDFDLGTWSGDENLGTLAMEAEVKNGKGLRIESVNADLQANVNILEYKGYVYRDFKMEGKFEKNLFDGNFLIADPNIDLDFSGTIDFTDSIPVYDFSADVNALKLKNLNILEEDFALKGNLVINANGTDINNAQGTASGSAFTLYKEGNAFDLDSFNLTAKGAYPERRNFILESSLADIELNGTFKIEELPDAFLYSLKRNYPNFTQQLTHFRNPNPSPGYDFNVNMTIRESEDIFEVLLGESIFIRDATVLGRISDISNRSALDISFPFLEVNGNVYGGISGNLFAQEDRGSLSFIMEYANINNVELSPIKVEASIESELLEFKVTSAELLDSFTAINIAGELRTEDDKFKVRLENTSFQAFGNLWEFNRENNVIFGNEYVSIEDLELSDGERALSFDNIGERGIRMNVKSLNTSFFNRLTKAQLQGDIDGFIEIGDIFKFSGLKASLSIPEFTFENHTFGNVRLDARSNDFKQPIQYELVAYDQFKNLRMDGQYNIDLKNNKGELRVNNYPLDLLEYIITDGMSDTEGSFTASAKYSGPLAYPELEGYAEISDGVTTVDYLGTRYQVGKNRVSFSEGEIDFSGGELIDSEGNSASVEGSMFHNAFRDFSIDLRILSDQFIALNTTKEQNPSYYGFAKGEMDVRFEGPFEIIKIAVNATTGRGTVLNLPVEYTAEEYSTDFVEIIDFSAVKQEKRQEEISLEGLSLDMNVNVTQDARVVILFDETAKDILESSGRGAIQLSIDPEGNFEMFGNYEVVSGQYLFTIPSLAVNKSFLIQNGGNIEWTGDPLDANLNIDATYRGLQASLTTFLEEYLPDPDGTGTSRLASLAQQRTDVSLTMDLGGTMSVPDIDFDISFPNLVGELKPLAEGKLRTLEANQDAYNDQVFGLILLRTFLPSNSNQVGNNILNSNNILGAGYSTISEFVSNQFSILLSSLFDEALQGDGYLTGVDVNLSANKNTLGISSNNLLPDEYNINFVSSFDEDKWNVQIGGRYVVNSAYVDIGTYFAPDFVVEYYITEDRRLKLNLYARSDYDASRSRKIQSGIGLSYRKEFNNLFDFADAIKENAQAN